MIEASESALIIADGVPLATDRIESEMKRHSIVVACDGAGNFLIQSGFKPDIVIGDLDSFNTQFAFPGLEVIQDKNQEINDLEKALHKVLQLGFKKAVILCAFGKRIDHTLKNISVLMQFDPFFDELFIKDDYGFSLMCRKHLSIQAPAGTTVSLAPLSGEVSGISTQGLEFPLHNESLQNGVRDGSSNRMMSDLAEIRVGEGALLVMVNCPDHSKLTLMRN